MASWLQGRDIIAEGCGREKLLTAWHPGSSEHGRNQRARGQALDTVPQVTAPTRTDSHRSVLYYSLRCLKFNHHECPH